MGYYEDTEICLSLIKKVIQEFKEKRSKYENNALIISKLITTGKDYFYNKKGRLPNTSDDVLRNKIHMLIEKDIEMIIPIDNPDLLCFKLIIVSID